MSRKKCPICRSTSIKTNYSGKMRPSGITSKPINGYKIIECKKCGVQFLDPFPENLRTYYSSKQYWTEHKKHNNKKSTQAKLDKEQDIWLSKIGVSLFRDKSVLDFGAGAGLFLDAITGYCSETIALDPSPLFKTACEEKGHLHISNFSEIEDQSLDCIVSFDTLEHLEDASTSIRFFHKKLKTDGEMFIGVPNQNDFLKELCPAYLSFFYHLSHLFYFNRKALTTLFERFSFQVINCQYVHKYDFSNLVIWLSKHEPQKNRTLPVFSKASERLFTQILEEEQKTSHLLLHIKKAEK